MKAIIVRYLGPTYSKGSRLKVIADGVKPITVSYDYGGTVEECKINAAKLMCDTYKWPKDLCMGDLPNGDVVFCFKEATV